MAPTNRTKRPIDSLATTATAVATSSPPARAASASSTNPPFAAATKRRVVSLADDANAVLAKCRKLRDELRKKQALQNANNNGDYDDDDEDDSTDLEWGKKEKKGKMTGKAKSSATVDDDDTKKAKTQQLSLSELRNMTSANNGKKTIVEVVEMNSTEVMEGIENVAVHIAHQVLAKQGFQLAIPCR